MREKQVENKLLNKTNQEIEILEKRKNLVKKFPDLEEYRGRWRTVLISKDVNQIVENVHFSHSCGCCNDAVLFAWTSINEDGIDVYSKPPFFAIGEKNAYGLGEITWENWEKELIKENIPEKIIDKIRKYLEENQPVNVEED